MIDATGRTIYVSGLLERADERAAAIALMFIHHHHPQNCCNGLND